ncbi:hypothetical protein GH714_036901 [Hevea brasiliensis]|uniref:Uncharacterized protein n=1 Tax=Hevea brasiliensis TaxID=3981 RepID=A0A6A6L4D9_HEVBR|nr:hypothetical protein GH714_036901 [Hevea brasiliensis]
MYLSLPSLLAQNLFGASVGQHLEAERMKVCSNITLFSCDNLCGNPLPCGNHYCKKTCLALKSQSAKSLAQHNGQPFEECHLPCEKKRKPT